MSGCGSKVYVSLRNAVFCFFANQPSPHRRTRIFFRSYSGNNSSSRCIISNCYVTGTLNNNNGNDVFKPKNNSNNSNINTGFYFINKKFDFNNFLDKFSIEKDFFEDKNRNIKIYAKLFDGDFLDIGTPDDYSKSETFVNKVFK